MFVPMPIHEEFVTNLSRCTPKELKSLGYYLDNNNKRYLSAAVKKKLQLHNYNIVCLSDGNSKIYQVTRADNGAAFILKLERWSMPQEIQQRFDSNASLKSAVAPVYFNKSCQIDERTMRIQIQPFCSGGTLESAARTQMLDEERIDRALKLYNQVASFYINLKKANILFPDGKPSNFTLNAKGELQLTDMKTYVDASPDKLAHEANINDPSYPLYIPIPPRQLDAVHARHFGMNLYAYLTGRKWDDFYIPHSNPKTPLPTAAYTYNNPIFKSGEGELLVRLIKNMIADNPAQRPSVEDAQKILNLVGQMRKIRFSYKEDADAEIVTTYYDFFKQNPALLRLANAIVVKHGVTNGRVTPDDAVKAFPDDKKILKVALAKNPTSWKHANASIVKDLVNDGKINPDDAVKAFPRDKDIICAALVECLTSLKYADASIIPDLVFKGRVEPYEAVQAFPYDKDIIYAAWIREPASLNHADAAIVKDLVYEAVQAFPYDKDTIYAAWIREPASLKHANASIVKDLVNDGKINPDDAVKAFPRNQEIIYAAFAQKPTSLKYANAFTVRQLVIDGSIHPDCAVQAFPRNQEIIYAAFAKNPPSLNYAKAFRVKDLVNDGKINPDDVMKACPHNQEIIRAISQKHHPIEEIGDMDIDKLFDESDNTSQQKTAQYKAMLRDTRDGALDIETTKIPSDNNTKKPNV